AIGVPAPARAGAWPTGPAPNAPETDVTGGAPRAATAPAEQATQNVQTVVEQIDPPRWPRLGAALPVEYDVDGKQLHGPGGLGGTSFPCGGLHLQLPAVKLDTQLATQPLPVAI